ncbi:MAG TPA: NF038122 family metalloprotease [Bryobacteraceae bacterium]|nr:NF038122 family metalloprotease [Bryobacteraceae bacterium]
MKKATNLVLPLAAAIFLTTTAVPAFAGLISPLNIVGTFDASILSDPNAASIENTINTAISFYNSTLTTATAAPVTVSIDFQNMSSGLGQSSTTIYGVDYQSFVSALTAASSGDLTDSTALSVLPLGVNNPVTGTNLLGAKTAELKALGFDVPPGGYDGIIGLNTSITNVNGGPYNLLSVVEHEMDEVLGLGSNLGQSFSAYPAPEDLFRYDASGNRSYTTDTSADAYFSLDGTNLLAQFDNQGDGGDWGDWQSNPRPSGVNPKVQDAFATPNSTPSLTVSSPEIVALDAIGYNLATPEPATFALCGAALLLAALSMWRRKFRTPVPVQSSEK